MNFEFFTRPSVQLAGGLLLATLLLDILIRRVLRRTIVKKENAAAGAPEAPAWRQRFRAVSASMFPRDFDATRAATSPGVKSA